MIQPFLRYLVLSIALSISLSRGKSTRMRKKDPFKPSPNDYEETCFDEEQARCENFQFFCGTRSRYMSQNCKLTCKMCEKGDPVTDLSSKCAVILEKHKETLCVIKEWIDTCPHSCKEFTCDNRAVDCEAMAKEGGCVSEHKFMTEHCKFSCLMCTPGDAVMDLTSECNPKQALCNGDQEWQSICPHTCRRYLPLQARQAQIAPPQNVNQPQVPVQPQLQQAGGVVQQPQQLVQQQVLPPNQPQVSPQVGPQAGIAVQTSQLQPQLQQPVIPNQSQVSPATQPAPQVTQPLQPQPQVQQTTSQVNPAMQTSQGQPQIQSTFPQLNRAPQLLQGQPQIQPTAPQVTSVLQPVQPQIQQTAPQVNPVMQSNQLQPQMQPTVSQTQPPYVQQQVQQQQPNQVQYPAGQMQAPQTSYQPQINQGQLPQQPQFGTVGPMKKQKETNPAKGSTVFEKTSNSQETVKKGKAKKVNYRRKMKAADGSQAKGKENTKKGKDTNNDLRLSEKINRKKKKLLTRLKEEGGSAAEHTIKVRKLRLQ